MSRTSLQNHNCSLARCIDIIGDKWTLLIIRDAFFGASTFTHFQRNLNVARNVLTTRLDTLVNNGVLEKIQTKPNTERYSYHLTEKGLALTPVLLSIAQWGDKWALGEGNEPILFVDSTNDKPIRKMTAISEDGRALSLLDFHAVPGPGADEKIRRILKPKTIGSR